MERHPFLGFIVLKVVKGYEAAVGFHVVGDEMSSSARIKLTRTFQLNAGKRSCKIRLTKNVAFFVKLSPVKKDAFTVFVFFEGRFIGLE